MSNKNNRQRQPLIGPGDYHDPVVAIPVQTQAITPVPDQVQTVIDLQPVWSDVVALEYLSVRRAPTTTSEVLMYLTRGKTYQVEISGKPWLKVTHPRLAGRIGYVSATILNDQPVKS